MFGLRIEVHKLISRQTTQIITIFILFSHIRIDQDNEPAPIKNIGHLSR